MFSKRITIALMLGFFGCQGEEGCANRTGGEVTITKSCETRCRQSCEDLYSPYHDGLNSIEWCTDECNKQTCLGFDAGRPSLDTGVNVIYDAGVLDSGLGSCVSDCLSGLMYPQCASEVECCDLYCNS